MANEKRVQVPTSYEKDMVATIRYLCHQKEIINHVLKHFHLVGKQANFKPAEMIGNVCLVPEEWTTENGFVTPAMKLKRKELTLAFKKEIEEAYHHL